jgi:hypothetical protein
VGAPPPWDSSNCPPEPTAVSPIAPDVLVYSNPPLFTYFDVVNVPSFPMVNSVTPEEEAVKMSPELAWFMMAAAFAPYAPCTCNAATGEEVSIPKRPLAALR